MKSRACRRLFTHDSSFLLVSKYLAVAVTEFIPIARSRRREAIPTQLEHISKPPHRCVQRPLIADGVQVVAVRPELGQADYPAIAQFAEQGNVRLANGPAEIALARHVFSLGHQIRRGLIGLKSLTQHNAGLAFLQFPPAPGQQPGRKTPDQKNNKTGASRDYQNLNYI